jgi:hypothetical protein
MQTEHKHSVSLIDRDTLAQVGRVALVALWHAIRLPLLATLMVLEPLVRVALSSIAVLGIVMAVFFEFVVRLPHFPFGVMLTISISSATLLVAYYLLIRLFSGPR